MAAKYIYYKSIQWLHPLHGWLEVDRMLTNNKFEFGAEDIKKYFNWCVERAADHGRTRVVDCRILKGDM